MSPSILTSAGREFDFVDPETNEFGIQEIAHALSHICRFTGHVKKFYSVAQHSVYVSKLVPQEQALEGLLHDAAEAFLGDVASPLKRLLPDYKRIEARVDAVVMARFGLPAELSKNVKHADMVMLKTEQRDLMLPPLDGWPANHFVDIEPAKFRITPMSSAAAKSLFIKRFMQLTCVRPAA
jgi:5'-deoxynucleotidase YfbR-like HD superfamily hydrolase